MRTIRKYTGVEEGGIGKKPQGEAGSRESTLSVGVCFQLSPASVSTLSVDFSSHISQLQ